MDRAGRSELHYAALNNDVSAVRGLIAAGAALDLQDKMGFTPLHMAAQQYATSAAAVLLDAGASVDLENTFGNTPLFVAVFNSDGGGDIIKLLRGHGADPLHANLSGQTPVGLARLIANYDVAQYFDDMTE